MNLFKVIASGKKPFFEEQMSAVLAWIMNPQMEHGLGYSFICRFLRKLNGVDGWNQLADNLVTRLRNNEGKDSGWICKLEDAVSSKAFIDIVLILNNEWAIAIENKIYVQSASRDKQLVREYEGLCIKYPDYKKALIFLVPCQAPYNENDIGLSDPLDKEYSELDSGQMTHGYKRLVTWQKSNIIDTATQAVAPSIVGILEELLVDESLGRIEPLPEYTRHTIKALIMFINSDFSGYDYEIAARNSGGMNPLADGRATYDKLRQMQGEAKYVGIFGGLKNLLQEGGQSLAGKSFQYSGHDSLSDARNWITYDTFMKAVSWRINNGPVPDIDWDMSLPSFTLYEIAKSSAADDIYIGISGGENGLRKLGNEEIIKKEWQIKKTSKAPSWQWMTLQNYRKIIEDKSVFRMSV